MNKKNSNSEVEVTDVLAQFKQKAKEKEMMKDLCDKEAFDIVYNPTTKYYDLVTVRYSSETGDAYVEKTEKSSDNQILAIDALNKRLDMRLLKLDKRSK